MSELLFFLLGLVIGSLAGMTIMCVLQINKVNELERIELSREENEKKNG